MAKILIDHGAPTSAQDWEGRTPLHYAARSGTSLRFRAELQLFVICKSMTSVNPCNTGYLTPAEHQ